MLNFNKEVVTFVSFVTILSCTFVACNDKDKTAELSTATAKSTISQSSFEVLSTLSSDEEILSFIKDKSSEYGVDIEKIGKSVYQLDEIDSLIDNVCFISSMDVDHIPESLLNQVKDSMIALELVYQTNDTSRIDRLTTWIYNVLDCNHVANLDNIIADRYNIINPIKETAGEILNITEAYDSKFNSLTDEEQIDVLFLAGVYRLVEKQTRNAKVDPCTRCAQLYLIQKRAANANCVAAITSCGVTAAFTGPLAPKVFAACSAVALAKLAYDLGMALKDEYSCLRAAGCR